MIDTLKYYKTLEAAGFPREQAEAQVNIIAEIVEGQLATKQDIETLISATSREFARTATKEDLQQLESRMELQLRAIRQELQQFAWKQDLEKFATKQDFEKLATQQDLEKLPTKQDMQLFESKMESGFKSVRQEIQQLEYKLTIKLGAIMVTLFTVFFGAAGLLVKFAF